MLETIMPIMFWMAFNFSPENAFPDKLVYCFVMSFKNTSNPAWQHHQPPAIETSWLTNFDDGSKWCKPLLRCSTVLLASAISTTEASTFAFTFGVTAGAGFGRCGFAYGALFANRSRSGNFWSSLGFTRAFKSSTIFFFSLADPLLGDCTKILYKERAVFCMALFLSLRKMISAIVSYGNVRQTK